MPAGRPTKYTPELLHEAKQYIHIYQELGDMMPSIAGLACHLKISRETCHAWNQHEDKQIFSDILSEILVTQENVLFNKGLSGDFNAAITKLALGKHGYSDQSESRNDHNINFKDSTDEELRAIINS